ncbi:hypothetical protein ACFYZN_11070 [Streptomyces sp. NPDC001777]|uniref:hypothetical protein n=1 Tax=Streptomyces sp. NPDC001777 TaxID=3364608 RepID=UPI00368DA2F3
MDTTRRTILRGMAAAPVVAATSGLLVPGEAAASNGVTAAPAEQPMGLTYDAAHSALLEESIRGLRDKEKLGRIDVAGVLRKKPQYEGRNGFPGAWWPGSAGRPDKAFRWSGADRLAGRDTWRPQGISTVHDATGQRGRNILLVSWYHREEDHSTNRGGRVAIIDLRGRTPKYWYALLVLPTRKAGGHSFEPLYGLHAGGLAWYGNRLYVTESRTGALYVFNTDEMFPVKGRRDLCGKDSRGDFHAFREPYAMPLSRVYRVDAQGQKRLKFSQVSVDRDPLRPYRSLVVNEWEPGKDHAIVARWDIGHNSPYPRTAPGAASAVSSAVYRVERGSGLPEGRGVQGAVSIRGSLYLSVSRGSGNGYYSGVRLDSGGVGTARKLWELPKGPEDLSYQGITPGTGRVWGLTEYADRRFVFGMRVSR